MDVLMLLKEVLHLPSDDIFLIVSRFFRCEDVFSDFDFLIYINGDHRDFDKIAKRAGATKINDGTYILNHYRIRFFEQHIDLLFTADRKQLKEHQELKEWCDQHSFVKDLV